MIKENVLYKIPFSYRGIHTCELVVLCCIDFRFWRETMSFVDELYGDSYDFPKLPGSAKAINESKEGDLAQICVDVPCNLHGVKKIIVVNHSDCGAYGGNSQFKGDRLAEQKFHEKELQKAFDILNKKYLKQEVILVYARTTEDELKVEFIEIKPVVS